MHSPLFSIIVPVYKVEKYLPQCVDSLVAQDFDNYEIILVDDGSPDRCPQICDEYAARYSHVKTVHKPNGGLSDARNKGVEVASGRYITFVDSDDFWRGTDVLSGVARIIDEYAPDIVVSDFIKYYTSSDKYIFPSILCDEKLNGKSKQEILEYLYFCQADLKMSACQKFAKRELLTSAPFTKGLLSEDIDWSLNLYPQALSICVYGKPYYCYRQQREGSITNTASQKSFDSLSSIITKWKTIIPQKNISQNEKQIYLGYLAYQLSIMMPLIYSLDRDKRKQSYLIIKNNIDLFRYPLNFKTKKVKLLTQFIGIKITSIILFKYIQYRHRFQASTQ